MPNDFSIEIHNYISKKFKEAEEAVVSGGEDVAFYLGQLEELRWIREYLKKHVDLAHFTYY